MATKILVVEDNTDSLRVLAMCLQQQGFTVEQAHNGLEAVQKLEDETLDVVVSDIRMPGLDGLELAGSILDRFAGTRIVLITAEQVVRRLEPGNLVGVSSVLIKPFPVKELIKAKRKAVAENNV